MCDARLNVGSEGVISSQSQVGSTASSDVLDWDVGEVADDLPLASEFLVEDVYIGCGPVIGRSFLAVKAKDVKWQERVTKCSKLPYRVDADFVTFVV